MASWGIQSRLLVRRLPAARAEHDAAVGGQPQVGLHPLQPERGHALDGAPGVLRNLAPAAAVGDDGRTSCS